LRLDIPHLISLLGYRNRLSYDSRAFSSNHQYFWQLRILKKQGYKIPPKKIALFASTTVMSVYAWGFNSFGMSFLIANIFHAVQYYALVWFKEQKSIKQVFGNKEDVLSKGRRFLLYISIPLFLGFLLISLKSIYVRSILVVCALMHFWYDSFIWSPYGKKAVNLTKN
jgi:hypothetical protein